jgi:hypothetical protein
MATVNKDFKIKSGLIVEGTSGTINGYDILTESQDSIDFIVGVIGGETLVTSVESTQLQVVGGELSVKDNVFDAAGAAAGALEDANSYTDGEITTALTTAQGYADDAEASANTYTDTAVSNEATDRGIAITNAINAEVTDRDNAIDTAINNEVTARNTAIGTAKSEAIADAATYTDGEINTLANNTTNNIAAAVTDANDYTDLEIAGEVTNRNNAIDTAINTEVTNRNSAIATAKGEANDYTDTAVANLVDGAPALLDTLNELAAALQDNPDIIADLQDVAAGKQDTLTAGTGIDITGATISVVTNTYDAYGSAATAETNANGYTDSAISTEVTNRNSAIATAKGEAIADAESYTDGEITTALTTAQGYATTAQGNAEDYTDNAISTEVTNRNSAISDAIATEVTDRNTAITTAVDAIDTDVVEEGEGNLYFTDSRAKSSAADLLTSASLTNITITGTGAGLTITAENGVADSTTDDLVEGEENLYFTDERAIDAVSNADIYPNAVIIDNVAKQVASQITAATAGIQIGHAFAKADYRSAEFLVKVAYGTHTEISKVLLTLDTSDNIAITEYGIVGTNGSASTISADISGTDARLLVTTANNNSTVTVVGTLLV